MINDMKKASFPITAVLTCIFVAAKLFGAIDWSWLWVLSPLWIDISIGILVTIFAAVGYIDLEAWAERNERKRAERKQRNR